MATSKILHPIAQRIAANISRVMVGKEHVIEKVLVALACQGHVLLEDLPGLGKTTLAKSLASSLGLAFKRIQFTPDLLPSDLTGVNYFHPRSGDFYFRPGPLFAQIVLADEINRATPRTQSALLEAMEERQVTIDGETHRLQQPFMVIATQNPVELAGTFPLPEAQLDRFLLRLSMGYPTPDEEQAMLDRFGAQNPLTDLQPVVSEEETLAMGREAAQVHVSAAIQSYLLSLVAATRSHPGLILGASPRASLALYRTTQALALLRGRSFVLPDDVVEMAPLVLAHRLKLNSRQLSQGVKAEQLVNEILKAVPVPAEPTEEH